MTLQELQQAIHTQSNKNGWWDNVNDSTIPEKLALVHSEVSEALECFRDGDMGLRYEMAEGYHQPPIGTKPEGFAIEIADIMIRCLDILSWLSHEDVDNDYGISELLLDPIRLMTLKHEYNKTRPHRHGGKRC